MQGVVERITPMPENNDSTAGKQPIKPGQHRAGYARDRRNGGYMIRVVGPFANRFAGREIPVGRSDGSEGTERLDTLVWTGLDDGEFNPKDKGQNIALYTFEARPRESLDDEIPF